MIAHETTISTSREVAESTTYERHYSSTSFWRKVRAVARFAGRDVTERALLLYYAVQNPELPSWARKVVYGALGYFILPTDAIPDLIPGVGFADDLGALAAAAALVVIHITPEVKARAAAKLAEWFDAPQED